MSMNVARNPQMYLAINQHQGHARRRAREESRLCTRRRARPSSGGRTGPKLCAGPSVGNRAPPRASTSAQYTAHLRQHSSLRGAGQVAAGSVARAHAGRRFSSRVCAAGASVRRLQGRRRDLAARRSNDRRRRSGHGSLRNRRASTGTSVGCRRS